MSYERSEEVIDALKLYKPRYSEQNMYDSLKSFVANHLQKLSPTLHLLYSNPTNFPSKETIGRALGTRKSEGYRKIPEKLFELFDCYLEHAFVTSNSSTIAQSGFTAETIAVISQRAMGICSFPGCLTPTFGPDKDNAKSIRIGIACKIYESSPDMSRYKILSTEAMYSAENAIWFCPNHNVLANANNGNNYTADELKEWKDTHEEIIREWLAGKKSIVFGLTFCNETDICNTIVNFLAQRQELFADVNEIEDAKVTMSIQETEVFLIDLKEDAIGADVEKIIDSMIRVCHYFLEKSTNRNRTRSFSNSFLALRKALGLSFGIMEQEYAIYLPMQISSIIPR